MLPLDLRTRSSVVAALLCALAPAALAQDLPLLPENAPHHAEVEANLLAQLEDGLILDGFRRWQADLVGDAEPDQLVQAVIAFEGGNGYFYAHYIFVGSAGRLSAFFPIQLNGPITAVRLEGRTLVFTLSTYRDGDPRCCPSGVEVQRMPLD